MITRLAIEERVREWGLREDVVEKDYVIGWTLWAIGSHPVLSSTWAFKGGTCLKKCYMETYRFSEDLDFTVLPGGPLKEAELQPILAEMLARAAQESGIDFTQRPPVLRTHTSGRYTEGRIYYRGPRGAPVASIRLDLSSSERVLRPTVLRKISHSYPDTLPEPATIRCYSFEELFAEKTRAMGERGRPRDLYDIINLYRRRDLRAAPELICTVLVEKCKAKRIPVPTYESALTSRDELRGEWENMLAHQLPALPPLETFWEELPGFFAWLEGTTQIEELPVIPPSPGEQEVEVWTPPPTAWTWGAPVPLETVRFAAANHLCIELRYGGSSRVIEPYSLHRTRDGHLLLRAIRVDSREPRAYRVDRMEALHVTTRPFQPVYRIEFSGTAPIVALPIVRPARPVLHPSKMRPPRPATRRPALRPRRPTIPGGVVYIVECTVCGKRFERKTRRALNRHKDRYGIPCRGRIGHLIGTR